MIGFDINSYEFECEKKTKHLLKQHNCYHKQIYDIKNCVANNSK